MTIEPIVAIAPRSEHQALAADLRACLQRHRELGAIVSLAVTSQMVGMLIAAMEGGKWSTETLSTIASQNISAGAEAQLLRQAERRSHAH